MLFKRPPPRIYYFCTQDHKFTMDPVQTALQSDSVRFTVLPYERVFGCKWLQRATYIFTDFDRLSSTELTAAAGIYRRLREHGARVLNNPAIVPRRDELMARLHKAGLNDFRCYRPAANEVPDAFPVFLRTITGHRGVLSELLETPDACDEALKHAVEKGLPVSDLIFVEYAAEPNEQTGHFQKHAAYFIAGNVIPSNIVNDLSWVAKHGVANLATPELYAHEKSQLDDYPYTAWARSVFACAQVDFGRVDFGVFRGRPQAYEINTNPTISDDTSHENPDRAETLSMIHERFLEAIRGLAMSSDGHWIKVRNSYRWDKFRRRLKRV